MIDNKGFDIIPVYFGGNIAARPNIPPPSMAEEYPAIIQQSKVSRNSTSVFMSTATNSVVTEKTTRAMAIMPAIFVCKEM